MNHTLDDQNMAFISQLYPDVYTQIVPQQGLSENFNHLLFWITRKPTFNGFSNKRTSGFVFLVSLSEKLIYLISQSIFLFCFMTWKPHKFNGRSYTNSSWLSISLSQKRSSRPTRVGLKYWYNIRTCKHTSRNWKVKKRSKYYFI